MPSSGTIRFEFDSGRAAESVSFTLGAGDHNLLVAYVKDALALEHVLGTLDASSMSFGVSARLGEPVVMRTKEPDLIQRGALLHHLRPFVLDDEPYSFYKVRKVVGRSSDSAFLKSRLKQIKRLFSGDQMRAQMVLSSGDMIVNSEATLKRWLNGFEYHRDPDKAQALEESLGSLPVNVTRPLFFMLLFLKARAVLHLGHVAAKMVGMPSDTDGQGGSR